MRSLESDDTDLERAVNLYAEGKELVAKCEDQLKSAQAKIDAVNAPPARAVEDAPDDAM
ncbi:MAG TPA: exodeoxyribonuclease VII small subunit [Candidatus Elarobacter sp.]|nr:exodeoxyribonuclease VII small subunit [Candidatus Elarobacter sp.]